MTRIYKSTHNDSYPICEHVIIREVQLIYTKPHRTKDSLHPVIQARCINHVSYSSWSIVAIEHVLQKGKREMQILIASLKVEVCVFWFHLSPDRFTINLYFARQAEPI